MSFQEYKDVRPETLTGERDGSWKEGETRKRKNGDEKRNMGMVGLTAKKESKAVMTKGLGDRG